MTAVQELGYSPNFAARAMAAKRTNTIGAIIPTMENAIFAKGLQAFQEELVANGYTLLVASSSYRAELEESQIRALVARGADGLLLIGHDRSAEIYDFLVARDVPALVTWAINPNARKASVGFNNRKAMRQMTEEVIGLGHRHLAMITAPYSTNDRARGRLNGIRDAMAVAGMDPDTLVIEETSYSIENGAEAFRKLMARTDRPTAVLCGNDVLATGALTAAREMGIDVPGDVSVTGFDDIELGQVTHPPLTTVHVPHGEMGQIAAKRLIAMVEGSSEFGVVELPTELRMRGSLAAPPPKKKTGMVVFP